MIPMTRLRPSSIAARYHFRRVFANGILSVKAKNSPVKTVYIMGAGASKHVGYPLTFDMSKQLFEWMAAYPDGRFRGSAELLVNTFGATPNIEDVITQLESSISSLTDSDVWEDKLQRSLLGTARGHLFDSLREWFRELHLHTAAAYAEFADNVIQPDDVVITFNYDDSLERELRRSGKWDVSQGYGFPLGKTEQPSPILILKLHGSINWLASIFGGVTSGPVAVGDNLSIGQHPVIHKADLDFLGYTDFSGHTYLGGGAFPSLILPGRNKEFFYRTSFGEEWRHFFDHLWSKASQALKQADKLVICGYSMPSADKRACDMILNHADKHAKVDIVCGSQGKQIADNFRNAGYGDVSFDATGYFEEWVHRASLMRLPTPA